MGHPFDRSLRRSSLSEECYSATHLLPQALEVLLGIFDEVENRPSIGPYYSFVLRLLLAFGITFQFPVFLFGAAAAGVVNSEQALQGPALGGAGHRRR